MFAWNKTIVVFGILGIFLVAGSGCQSALPFHGEDLDLARARDPGYGVPRYEFKERRQTLVQLAENCHGDERPECPILDDLAALGA